MEQKHIYDVRGRQSLIFRLFCSDKEALLHAVSYRIAIIFAFITFAAMIWSLHSSGIILNSLTERLTIIFGILLIPQLFESLKAFMLILSGGIVFGRLNASFLKFSAKGKGIYQLYKLIPYIVTAVWVIGLIWLALLWSI